jgi:hypothetical protein
LPPLRQPLQPGRTAASLPLRRATAPPSTKDIASRSTRILRRPGETAITRAVSVCVSELPARAGLRPASALLRTSLLRASSNTFLSCCQRSGSNGCLQFTFQPCFRQRPSSFDRGRRFLQDFRRLFHGQASEKAQFHDMCELRIQFAETVQRFVQFQQIDPIIRARGDRANPLVSLLSGRAPSQPGFPSWLPRQLNRNEPGYARDVPSPSSVSTRYLR